MLLLVMSRDGAFQWPQLAPAEPARHHGGWGLVLAPALLHSLILSCSLKPQARALLELELAQDHQHSTQVGPWALMMATSPREQSSGTSGTGGPKASFSSLNCPKPEGSAGFSRHTCESEGPLRASSALNLKSPTLGKSQADSVLPVQLLQSSKRKTSRNPSRHRPTGQGTKPLFTEVTAGEVSHHISAFLWWRGQKPQLQSSQSPEAHGRGSKLSHRRGLTRPSPHGQMWL